jgi:hypothetical protein
VPPPRILSACGLVLHHALKCSSEDYNIHILIIQIELFIYEFFSFRFLTMEAMLPLLPCMAPHWLIEMYCHVLSDYRRVLGWQLRLLDHSAHFTIHYSALHCLPSAESLLGWAQDLLQTQLSTFFFSSKSLYGRRTVSLSIMVSSPIWGSRPDIN